MACRDCAWWSQATPASGVCDWFTLAIVPFWLSRSRRVQVTTDSDGEGCPQFKEAETPKCLDEIRRDYGG